MVRLTISDLHRETNGQLLICLLDAENGRRMVLLKEWPQSAQNNKMQ